MHTSIHNAPRSVGANYARGPHALTGVRGALPERLGQSGENHEPI